MHDAVGRVKFIDKVQIALIDYFFKKATNDCLIGFSGHDHLPICVLPPRQHAICDSDQRLRNFVATSCPSSVKNPSSLAAINAMCVLDTKSGTAIRIFIPQYKMDGVIPRVLLLL
jgi:hypothetical protein